MPSFQKTNKISHNFHHKHKFTNTCNCITWFFLFFISLRERKKNQGNVSYQFYQRFLTYVYMSTSHTPFTKTSLKYPHKNNADNSIKIAFTNSELPKVIRTLFTSAH